jgi:hypothetical protein
LETATNLPTADDRFAAMPPKATRIEEITRFVETVASRREP